MIPPALIEAVAREACKQMGLDADEVATKAPYHGAPLIVRPEWATREQCRSWGGKCHWEWLADDARKAIAFARAVKLCDTEQAS